MTAFILVHGGMHGGWCWERVAPLLETRGHVVLTPDLPGLGADPTPAAQVTLQGWGHAIAKAARGLAAPAILVGHSMGGLAISQAAEFLPGNVEALVYVSAVLLGDGQSAADLPRRETALRLLPTPDGHAVTANPVEARAALYNTTPADIAERAIARLVPQPAAILGMKLALSAENFGRVRRIYVECLQDRVLPPAVQREMQAALPCADIRQIDTDHSPFYSNPEGLAAILLDIASGSQR